MLGHLLPPLGRSNINKQLPVMSVGLTGPSKSKLYALLITLPNNRGAHPFFNNGQTFSDQAAIFVEYADYILIIIRFLSIPNNGQIN